MNISLFYEWVNFNAIFRTWRMRWTYWSLSLLPCQKNTGTLDTDTISQSSISRSDKHPATLFAQLQYPHTCPVAHSWACTNSCKLKGTNWIMNSKGWKALPPQGTYTAHAIFDWVQCSHEPKPLFHLQAILEQVCRVCPWRARQVDRTKQRSLQQRAGGRFAGRDIGTGYQRDCYWWPLPSSGELP